MLPLNRESPYFSATFAVKIKETDSFLRHFGFIARLCASAVSACIERTQTSAPAASSRDRLFCDTIPLLNPEMAGSS